MARPGAGGEGEAGHCSSWPDLPAHTRPKEEQRVPSKPVKIKSSQFFQLYTHVPCTLHSCPDSAREGRCREFRRDDRGRV